MNDLFEPAWQCLPLPDADITLQPDWLPRDESDALLADLLAAIPWENHRLKMFGREVASPRLSCWIGDDGAGYTYSRTRFEPHPWPSSLAALRPRIAQACSAEFNSVLANLYRDGNDSMGWHSDDEPELGARPVIASLSLGATRSFRLRRRLPRGTRAMSGDSLAVPLTHGSLLRMAGDTQQRYRHEVPKTRMATLPRINLTFRWINPSSDR